MNKVEEKKVRIRSLAEFEDEKAIDLLADLIVPASNIFTDDYVKEILGFGSLTNDHKKKKKKNETLAEVASGLLKRHKKDVLAILELLADGPYHCTPFSIVSDVLTVMNDKELMDFFSEQGINITAALSGGSSEVSPEEK